MMTVRVALTMAISQNVQPIEVLCDITAHNGTHGSAEDGDQTCQRHGGSPLFYGEQIACDGWVQADGRDGRPREEPEHDDHGEAVTETGNQGEDEEREVEEMADGHTPQTLGQRANIERSDDLPEIGHGNEEH
jgi:hypothetical protein